MSTGIWKSYERELHHCFEKASKNDDVEYLFESYAGDSVFDRYRRSKKTCTDIDENKTDYFIDVSFNECQEEEERSNP